MKAHSDCKHHQILYNSFFSCLLKSIRARFGDDISICLKCYIMMYLSMSVFVVLGLWVQINCFANTFAGTFAVILMCINVHVSER